MSRIVITGVGACSSVGDTANACFDAFLAGKTGNGPLKHLEETRYNSVIAYERDEVGDNGGRYRSSGFLSRAIVEAITSGGIDAAEAELPVYVGTGLRELRTVELAAIDGDTLNVSDLDFTKAVKSVLPKATEVYTLSNACAASNYAIALAMDAIEAGAPMAVAAGCDTLTSSMFGLLDRVNPNTVEAVQVFDKNRKGVLMGDGGVALIIETEENAIAHGRTPLAWLRAVGMSTDAVHETAPDKAGILRALNDGYSRAGIKPDQVDLIYVHGTGTSLNDGTEASVLATAFADVEQKPTLSGLKSMTGHTSGASGAMGVIAGVHSLQSGRIPPTPGTDDQIEEVKGFTLLQTKKTEEIDVVQVNAFGFGGVNSVVLLSKYPEMKNAI